MSYSRFRFLLWLLVVFLITSCSAGTGDIPGSDPTQIVEPTLIGEQGYPVPVESDANPGYPAPLEPEFIEILVVPTPTADMGVLTGYIINRLEDGTVEPFAPKILALGDIVSVEGQPLAASLPTFGALKTLTDSHGRFVFDRVPPGNYVLIVDNLSETYMLNDPVTNGDFIFEIVAGQVTDLGEMTFDQLP